MQVPENTNILANMFPIVSDIYLKVTRVKVILYSYLILKKMNERITDSYYCNKYT